MGKATKQAKNRAKKQKVKVLLDSVKGSLQKEMTEGLGDDILNVLKQHNGRL